MIPIGSEIPRDSASLRAALSHALQPLRVAPDAVVVDGEFPAISRLAVCLDGAEFTRELRTEKAADGAVEEGGFFAREVVVRANPAQFEGTAFQAALHANDAVFAFKRSTGGGCVMQLKQANSGTFDLAVQRQELERVLLAAAAGAATEHGAEIRSMTLEFTSQGPRTLSIRASATAKAMLFTAGITITGTLEISDALEASLRGLACQGDGMLGSLAAGFLRPRFAELEKRVIPLGRALGGITLRTVEVSGGDALRIRGTLADGSGNVGDDHGNRAVDESSSVPIIPA